MAFHTSQSSLDYLKYALNCSGSSVLEEKLLTRHLGLVLHKNHFLFQLAEDILQHTIDTGIIHQSSKYHNDFIQKDEVEVEDDEPKVLTLKDLSFGFNIVLIALGVSSAVFVIEVVYFYLKVFITMNIIMLIGKGLVLLNVIRWLRSYK
jgi:hypothetical protein